MKKRLKLSGIVTIIVVSIFMASLIYIVKYREFRYLAISLPLFIYSMMAIRRSKKNEDLALFNQRIHIYWYICILLTLILAIRFFYIQVLNGSRYSTRAIKQANKVNKTVGSRGIIYDKNKNILAYDVNEYDFIINPIIVSRSRKLMNAIQKIDKDFIDLSIDTSDDGLKKLSEAKRGAGYKVVVKGMDEETKDSIVNYLSQNKIFLGSALQLKKRTKRGYKDSTLTPILGLVAETRNSNGKKIGIFGVERGYEKYLKGNTVKRRGMFTSSREMKLPTSADQVRITADGRNLYLTIDSFLQYILSDEVKRKFDETEAEEAIGIIMDPNTGKILASTAFAKNPKSLRNPIIQNQYEPGSTFKPIIVSSALNEGLVNQRDTFDVGDGKLKKYGHTIRESSRHTRGVITLSQVLEKSSNIGMVLISERMPDSIFEEYLRRFGFGSRTGVDLPGEISPYLTKSRKWDGLKKNTMAFGQGIAVTPLQLITGFSAIINGGTLYRPYVVDRVVDENDTTIMRNTPFKRERVISEDVAEEVKEILEKVVADGTGKNGRVAGFHIGGKTGTAQISGPGGYIRNQYLASFIGFLPVDKPKYVILTMFLKPHGKTIYNRFGGAVAAPVFAKIASRIIKHDDLIPKDVDSLGQQKYLEDDNYLKVSEVMPDLRGKTAREVIRIFSNLNLKITIDGSGRVEKQVPKKGTSLSEIKEVKLYLE